MSSLVDLAADRATWYALTRTEKLQHITAALDGPCDEVAQQFLSTTPPSGWTSALKRSTAWREYGFPADPVEGDVHTAWDGSRWRYTSIPWWKQIDDDVFPF
ncbi:hypothetical protein [Nocardia farcinica]|uniref:Uncharacterized protein n=1 Tax=Nocardia farcinica (strain IFM 10152) TaxID=247156 RepID=Q5YSI5_NOCFA|nr:hypothetical protein [Nocardia farcinica]BAD58856.1 hypothetical protein NFA_40080 [Nocardia farcinica IFM 10152]